MTLIDHVRRLHTAAVERLHPRPVVFHHVPKCGGTSVGRALRKKYLLSQAGISPESSFKAMEAFTGSRDRDALLIDVLDFRQQMLLYHLFEGVHCVSAHVGFNPAAYERFHPKYRFVTILREPVSRFLSHYTWSYGKPQAHGRIEEPFSEFLKTERARRLGATYVEYFCGLSKSADIRSAEAIDAAVANLGRFDVVGRLDDLQAFESKLEQALDLRLRIGHENKAKKRTGASSALSDPDLKAEVMQICEPDLAVWRRFVESESRPQAAVAV